MLILGCCSFLVVDGQQFESLKCTPSKEPET